MQLDLIFCILRISLLGSAPFLDVLDILGLFSTLNGHPAIQMDRVSTDLLLSSEKSRQVASGGKTKTFFQVGKIDALGFSALGRDTPNNPFS